MKCSFTYFPSIILIHTLNHAVDRNDGHRVFFGSSFSKGCLVIRGLAHRASGMNVCSFHVDIDEFVDMCNQTCPEKLS